MDKISQISANVKKYYEHNWQAIANCYQKDSDDLPIDPAWYRREIYLDYLEKYNPKKILDVGCGGGQTVLDGLIHGADVVGLEPISNLVHHGKHLLKASGFSESAIKEGDTSNLNDYEKGIFDSVAMLSVIPHVPIADWESLHSRIADLLKTN
jgi:2-polyprenyl-3-methyl-5-hydroxy-6-metoxy-1,4-benzoquinol methylase